MVHTYKNKVKILHFSDIHITIDFKDLSLLDVLFNKRMIGIINFFLRRKRFFKENKIKIDKLIEFVDINNIDYIIFSGDYTSFGLSSELAKAKKYIFPLLKKTFNYISVPGNHDIYVNNRLSKKNFYKYFKDYLTSDLPNYITDSYYPVVRLIGNDIAIIAINSSKANILPWVSSGYISREELLSLENILQMNNIRNRFIIIVTHYPICLPNGELDKRFHNLLNIKEFIEKCKLVKKGMFLCGHIHETYKISLNSYGLNLEQYCAGSATMKNKEGFWLYELEDKNLIKASRVIWDSIKNKYYY